jgi:dTDP-4-dehydrorhamnose 3,5-epimerase
MKIVAQQLSGMYLIWGEPYADDRGVFRRHFCKESLLQHGIEFDVKQGNISENPHTGTLRGFHFQLSPYAEQKILTVLSGSLWNVTVDLRPDSPTYRQYQVLQLNASDRQSLLIPAGTANAFLTMADNTLVHYYMSEFFQADSYRGFHYLDPDLAITWPAPIKFISDRDDNLPSLRALGVFA